jgi:hypothetical protein
MPGISLDFEVRRGRLQFYLLPRLEIRQRYLLAWMVLLIGASLILRVHPVVGAPLWLTGLILMVARNTRNMERAPVISRWEGPVRPKSAPHWVMAAPKELRKIRRKLNQIAALPKNPLNGPSATGIITLAGLVMAFLAFNFLSMPAWLWLGEAWGILFMEITLLLVLFFTTLANARKPDFGKKKLELMEQVLDRVQQHWEKADPRVNPMLQLEKTGEERSTPTDLKLCIRFANAPEDFIGVHVQITFNQGPNGEVPYLYCVVLAKAGFQPLADFRPSGKAGDTLETGRDGDINYLVVRQTANDSGGYRTSESDVNRLLDRAMELSMEMLGR